MSIITLCTLEGRVVTQDSSITSISFTGSSTQRTIQTPNGVVSWVSDMDVDADGGYHAYNQSNTGLDDIRNAKDGNGGWCGVVVDLHGNPIVQDANDPAPGYYVSPTSYRTPGSNPTDPRSYLNSESIPFIVIENFIRRKCAGIALGSLARLTNLRPGPNYGKSVWGLVGDLGPLYKIGEGSIAAARQIGVNNNARTGGESDPFIKYEFWPGVPALLDGVQYHLIAA